MKKLITLLLILALALPAAALADASHWMFESTWVSTEYHDDDAVTIQLLCLLESEKAMYITQRFSADGPGFYRAFVGSWEMTDPNTIHVIIGETAEMDLYYSSYNMMYDIKTRRMFFRSQMGRDDVAP